MTRKGTSIDGSSPDRTTLGFGTPRSALLAARQQFQTPNPIGWDKGRERSDIDLAHAKFQSAVDLSVDSFREIVLGFLGETGDLRQRLGSSTN